MMREKPCRSNSRQMALPTNPRCPATKILAFVSMFMPGQVKRATGLSTSRSPADGSDAQPEMRHRCFLLGRSAECGGRDCDGPWVRPEAEDCLREGVARVRPGVGRRRDTGTCVARCHAAVGKGQSVNV